MADAEAPFPPPLLAEAEAEEVAEAEAVSSVQEEDQTSPVMAYVGPV